MADRESPDYRNAIKEAISAVEAAARVITGDRKATLGKALKAMKKQQRVKIHPALEKAYITLYGYTSDEDGIRHGMAEEPDIGYEEAQYMVISCSAFVNYMIGRAQKSGVLSAEAAGKG